MPKALKINISLLCKFGALGFEPRLRAPKTLVLPLDDAPASIKDKAVVIETTAFS